MGAMFFEDGALLNEGGLSPAGADELMLEGWSLMELLAERQAWRDQASMDEISDRLIEIEDELSSEGYGVPSWD